MTQFDIQANMRTLSGALILALEDEANGYYVRRGGLLGQSRPVTSRESTSPWVDGSSFNGATKDAAEGSLLVKVFGPDWITCETRYQALLDLAPMSEWIYEEVIQGVSKSRRAGPVVVLEPPIEPEDMLNNRRFVALTFKVQPTATITYLGA